MPAEDARALDAKYPGFFDAQIAIAQSWIEARLRKRYAVPFASPMPEAFLGWIVALVTLAAYLRRGWNPKAEDNALVSDAATSARTEVKEAADSKDGLFDLPLRADAPDTSAISKGGPLGYSEQSPYTWTDLQRNEVDNGGG